MNPPCTVVEVLAADSVERQALAPDAGLGPIVNSFYEATEDAGVRVGRTGGEEDRVWVPGESGDSAADGLLDVFADPPVIFGFEVTNGDDAGTGADGEFLLIGRPAHEGGGAIDPEENECGFPTRRGRFPDVSVAVCMSSVYEVCVMGRVVPWEQVTIMPLCGAMSTPVTVLS